MIINLFAATAAAFALLIGSAAADMRDAFKEQQKATDYLNSCLHYDKAHGRATPRGLASSPLVIKWF